MIFGVAVDWDVDFIGSTNNDDLEKLGMGLIGSEWPKRSGFRLKATYTSFTDWYRWGKTLAIILSNTLPSFSSTELFTK